jgi:DNA-binding NtrC family response regulator
MNPEPSTLAPSPTASRRPVVVFADDDPQILLALERTLRDEPYDLHLTTDPGKALEWVRSRNVSVVVSDYRMPGMSGIALLEQALACSPRTARILLTGFPGEEPVRRAREAGFLTLSAKPWDGKELARTIRDRIRERELLEGL